MLSFKPAFSLSYFTFFKRPFNSSLLSAIGVVSFTYLGILLFLPAILIPVCNSSGLAFQVMYSAYQLNKQGDNIQPWRTPFLVLNHSVVPCAVLIFDSWPAYKSWRVLTKHGPLEKGMANHFIILALNSINSMKRGGKRAFPWENPFIPWHPTHSRCLGNKCWMSTYMQMDPGESQRPFLNEL